MQQGQGGSTPPENIDRTTGIRRRRRIFKRTTEKKNPGNAEFERQVAAIEARHEQERMRQLFALLGWDNLTDESGEDDNKVAPNDHPKRSLGQASNELKQETNSNNSDFLEGTFLKISSDKQKSTRNKKNSKNRKKKKAKSRKQLHASEMQSELCPEPSSACANAGTSGENLPFSSSYVAIDVPMLEYSSSSSSSPVIEFISPVSSVSSSNDKELSSDSNGFRSFSTSYYSAASSPVKDCSSGSNTSVTNDSYTDSNSAWDSTVAAAAVSLSDVRTEWSWSGTGLTDCRGFNKWGGNRNKPNNDHESSSVTIISPSSSSHEVSLCGDDDASHDGEFQKVISRKTAQKMKRTQCLQSPTMASSLPISAALVPRGPSEITIGHYIKDDCLSGRKTNHKKGKYQKRRRLGGVPKTGFTGEENVPGQSRMLDITVHPGNLETSQLMPLSSTSHHGEALEVIEDQKNCSSGCQGELKDLAQVDPGDAKDTDSGAAAFSDKTSTLEHRLSVNSSSVDREEQKKEENDQALSSHESKFDKIIEAVNIAYEIEAAAILNYRTCRHPVADIENFIQSATPVIGQVPCTTNNSCMLDQQVRNLMQSVALLRSVWKWYEEPESFGIEVEMQRGINNRSSGTYSWSKLCAYFVPSLSAVQLFGQSPNDGGRLLFQYFESEKPFLRLPLFTKIKQLVSGKNLSGNPIFGDPSLLESVKLSDLHPASWFCVAWYPIYQIPSAGRSCQASFLTYHSLGKLLVPKNCSKDMADGLTTPIMCPIVGLLGYKCHGENWFNPGEQLLGSKPTSGGSMETDLAEHLNLRLEALKHGASALSKAVVPRATGEFMNYHPDHAFFSTRAL